MNGRALLAAAAILLLSLPAHSDEIRLRDGRIIRGYVVAKVGEETFIQTLQGRLVKVESSEIRKISVPPAPPSVKIHRPRELEAPPQPATQTATTRLSPIRTPKAKPEIPEGIESRIHQLIWNQNRLVLRKNEAAVIRELKRYADEYVDYVHWSVDELQRQELGELAEMVLKAIGEAARRDSLQRILPYLDHPDAAMRTAAVDAAGRSGDSRALTLLVHALEDEERVVYNAAISALQSMHLKGMDVSRTLLKPATSKNALTRSRVAKCLGKIHARWAVDALFGLLGDLNEPVRVQAILALELQGDAVDPSALARGLDDPNADVRRHTAAALGRLDAHDQIPALTIALGDSEPRVVKSAHDALKRITGSDLGPDPGEWIEWWDREGARRQD